MNKIVLFAAVYFLSFYARGQNPKENSRRPSINLKYGAHRLGKREDPDMKRWRAYGLGQFIHWGLYAIPGGEWKGKEYNGAAEWIRSWEGMPKSDYDSLYHQFNPANFNPVSWAEMARQMGVRYVTFTTKHHDGFCLWPSKFSDYTISKTPYRKDIVKAVVDAYTNEGIDVILYFSVMDWHHPGWRYELKTKQDSVAFEGFKEFTRNQLLELLNNYPKIKGFWFDGTWDKSWVRQAAFADELEKEMRKVHPGLIIGSRFRADENGARHFDSNGDLMGDYEQGWERVLPNKIEDVHGNDWDAVMTVPENQWGYNKSWKGHLKTSAELIEMTAKSVSLGGNFVLNFGPQADGAIRMEEQKLAGEIGEWMQQNKEAIYDCEYAGLEKQDWGYFTKKRGSDKIYMIVCNVPLTRKIRIKLQDGKGFKNVRLLRQPEQLLNSEKLNAKEYFIQLPSFEDKKPVVVELELIRKENEGNFEKAKI